MFTAFAEFHLLFVFVWLAAVLGFDILIAIGYLITGLMLLVSSFS